MGWFSTIRAGFRHLRRAIAKAPKLVKKKVIRSKPIRSILVKHLGRALTSLFEVHILTLSSLALKIIGLRAIEWWAPPDTPTCAALRVALEWSIDILVPTAFALQLHEPFRCFVAWTFERPLHSVARRIQYMRTDDPFQFYRIKYGILVPVLVYAWCLMWLVPISREILHICLFQTLLIHLLTDFWPLRHTLGLDAGLVWRDRPPTRIRLIPETNTPFHSDLGKSERDRPEVITPILGAMRYTKHIQVDRSDPFADVVL